MKLQKKHDAFKSRLEQVWQDSFSTQWSMISKKERFIFGSIKIKT